MRTIIDLPAAQLEALGDVCRREGISRAEAIRQAVSHYLNCRRPIGGAAFGLWRDRPIEGLEYERQCRDEWDGRTAPARRPPRVRR